MWRRGKMCVANGVGEAKTSMATNRSLFDTIASLVFDLALDHVAEHALAHIVIVAQRLEQSVPHLAWDDRRRDQLRMGMLQARSGVERRGS